MGLTQGPATGQAQSDAKKRSADIIRDDTSVYFQAFAMNPQNFVATAAKEFDALKNSYTNPRGSKGMSDFQYLIAGVRAAGMSKGTGPLTQFDPEDYTAIKEVYQGGYLAGTDWLTWLDNKLQSPYGTGAGGPTFSKDITSALQLLDATDAASKLSKAYFAAYNKMPSQKLVNSFMADFNAEAKSQLATTTTTTNTTGSGTSKSSSKKTAVTSGEGFTATEQNEFLAGFLKDNFKITGKEEAGQAITIIKGIQRAYKDNLLPVPPTDEIAEFAANIIGTGDADMAKQKMDSFVQGIRTTAAKFYPSMRESLAEGQDIKTYVAPALQAVNGYLDTNWDITEPRVKEMINYSDGKGGFRSMNANELEAWALKQSEAQTSNYGRSKAMELAQAFKDGLR